MKMSEENEFQYRACVFDVISELFYIKPSDWFHSFAFLISVAVFTASFNIVMLDMENWLMVKIRVFFSKSVFSSWILFKYIFLT